MYTKTKPAGSKRLNEDDYYFFWGGVFSNFYELNNKKESFTSEHIFMQQKAIMFDDKESVAKMAVAKSPMEVKRLGRKVKNFDPNEWDEYKELAMMSALAVKLHNQEFRDKLQETKDKIIVEASPDDAIWGIGYGKENAYENYDNWGQNLLGECIMAIREYIV